MTRTMLASEGQILAEVQVALAQLDVGTFGLCKGCGRAIGKARLDALPYAQHCVRCARATTQDKLTTS